MVDVYIDAHDRFRLRRKHDKKEDINLTTSSRRRGLCEAKRF
jgi:hypothetical protein